MFEITTQSINQLLISHHRTCQKQDRTCICTTTHTSFCCLKAVM